MDLHREALVVDCHSHFLINAYLRKRRFHVAGPRPWFFNPFINSLDLDSAVKGSVNALAFTIYTPGRPFWHNTDATTHRIIDRYYEVLEECQGKVVHCNTAAQIQQTVRKNRVASFLAAEGGHILEGELDNIHHFYQRGLRMLTLTHFVPNGIADGTPVPYRPHKGLTEFGRQVIREMEQTGMMVDVAHCTDEAMYQVLDVATKPVIYSHGFLRRYLNQQRNIPDDLVKAIAAHQGLVGIIFYPKYFGRAGRDVTAIARNARDIAQLAGPEYICLGSDMDGGTYMPRGFVDASDWPQVTQALLDEGFSEDETRGILGGNFMNYFERMCG